MQENLDIRHISIIDSLPVYETKKEILTVGCGSGYVESKLQEMGYDVIATDYFDKETRENTKYLDKINYHKSSIFDLSSFPVEGRETVICSEVLEHLPNYQEAFVNLLELTHRRLIVTIPWNISYDVEGPPPEGHCNYWTDKGENPFTNNIQESEKDINFKDIREFITLAWPYHVTISKIATKGEDWITSSRCYMIVVDKGQMTDFVWKRNQIPHVWQLMQEETGRLKPVLQPVNGKISGIPPTRIGPYMSYEVQPLFVLFTDNDVIDKHKDWLGKLEAEVSEALDKKLIVMELSDTVDREEISVYVDEVMNKSSILDAVVFMVTDNTIEHLGEDLLRKINAPKAIISENLQVGNGVFDFSIQRESLTDTFAKKILNDLLS